MIVHELRCRWQLIWQGGSKWEYRKLDVDNRRKLKMNRRKFEKFLKRIGAEQWIEYAESMIVCDADKFEQYRTLCVDNNIPYEEGLMIYLISKIKPYSNIARVKMDITEFIIEYHKKLFDTGG